MLSAALTILLATNTPILRREVLSEVYTIDRKYRSMEGPYSVRPIFLGDSDKPELLWLVGVKTEMVAADGKTPQLPELMCHVNVDYDAARHGALFNSNHVSQRLVTLSQGAVSVRVPDGYGFPVASNEPLQLFTQVLNHNIEKPNNLKVRHRVTFEYVRDRDLKQPMKPLLNVGASGMVLLAHNPFATPAPVDLGGAHGASCLMAPRAPNAITSGGDYIDPKGRKFTGHWIVPPGRQVNHSDVTWFMDLPFDTRLHYAAVHLHPFAESLTLRDVTTDQTIFSARAENPKGRVGLTRVDAFESAEGVPLYHTHQYELVSVYNNPTTSTADSMASMFLGIEDPSFVRPSGADLAARAESAITHPDSAVIETSVGGIGLTLMPQSAPGATRQFAAMIREGDLAGARVTRVVRSADSVAIYFDVKTNADRLRILKNLSAEGPPTPERVTLSLCGTKSDAATFAIAMGVAPKSCRVFGIMPPGVQALRTIVSSKKPVTITGASVYENGVKLSALAPH